MNLRSLSPCSQHFLLISLRCSKYRSRYYLPVITEGTDNYFEVDSDRGDVPVAMFRKIFHIITTEETDIVNGNLHRSAIEYII